MSRTPTTPTTPTTNSTTTTSTTTTSSTSTEAAAGAPTGGGGGGVVPEFPGGWDLLSEALTGAVASLADGVAWGVDTFSYHLLTLPAAGDPTAPSTWATVEDPYWVATWTVYGMMAALVLPLVWGVGWFNVGYPRGVARRERLKNVALAVGGVLGGWPALQLWLHFWNEATLAFAPAAGEFLSTPGSATKLGVGVVLGGALVVTKALIVLGGLLIHLVFVLLTFAFVALWPLSIALYLTDVPAVDAIGNAGVTGTLMLGPLQFIKAVVLRLLFELPLDAGDPATFTSFLLIVVGVLLAFVGIPYYGLKRLLPRSVVTTGRHAGRRGADRVDDLRDRAPEGSELKDRVARVTSEARSRLGRRDGNGAGSGSTLQSRTRDAGSGETLRARLDARDDTRTRTNTTTNRSTTDDD